VTDEQPFVGDPPSPLRHRAFFHAAGQLQEGTYESDAMMAGLVLLRLSDKWSEAREDTEETTEARSADFAPVEAKVASLADTPVKRILSELVVAIRDFSQGRTDRRTAPLIAYAQFLESDKYWEPAANVYALAIEIITTSGRDADLLPTCYEGFAHSLREAKQLVQAHRILSQGIAIATEQSDQARKQQNEHAMAWLDRRLSRMQIAMGLLSGEMLEQEQEWESAAEIYAGTVELIKKNEQEKSQLPSCYERAAYCLRQIGEIERAENALNDGIEVALQLNDVHWSLHLRISYAIVERQKGDLPEAEFELDTIIQDASEANDRDMLATALHERGLVAYQRSQDAQSVEYCYAAAQRYTDPKVARRALLDAAVALADLGHLDYARKMCEAVRRAPDDGRESRALAGVNLMRYAALGDDRPTFDRLRRELEAENMSGRLRAHYYLFIGQSFRHFGDSRAARKAFEQAIAVAERYRVYKLVIETEALLAAADDRPVVWMEANQNPALAAMFEDIDAHRGLFAEATTM
jgi:tetratricopeptide (TPR) repeat protein